MREKAPTFTANFLAFRMTVVTEFFYEAVIPANPGAESGTGIGIQDRHTVTPAMQKTVTPAKAGVQYFLPSAVPGCRPSPA